jgi:hypothetical protein
LNMPNVTSSTSKPISMIAEESSLDKNVVSSNRNQL